MNEDSRESSAVGGALKVAGIGALGYGAHKLATSDKAYDYINDSMDGLDKKVKAAGGDAAKIKNLDVGIGAKMLNKYQTFSESVGAGLEGGVDAGKAHWKANKGFLGDLVDMVKKI